MLKRVILLYFTAIAIWILIDKSVNNRFSDLTSIDVSYLSENGPINFSFYYSSSAVFGRESFNRKVARLIAKNTYQVSLELNQDNINYIRLDPEFKHAESEIFIQDIILKSEGETIKIAGEEIHKFIEKSYQVEYENTKLGLRFIPSSLEPDADHFVVLSPIRKIGHFYLGGIERESFLNFVLLCLVAIIIWRAVKESDNFYWILITGLFTLTIFLDKTLLSWSSAFLSIISVVYIFKNGLIKKGSKVVFTITLIYFLYIIYFLLTGDLSIMKLLEYQATLILFPLIFYFLKLSENDICRTEQIFEVVSYTIILIVCTSVSLVLIESKLSILEFYHNAAYLKSSALDWIDNTLHPSFLSYGVFIGLLFSIKNTIDSNKSLIKCFIWLAIYLLLMVLIGSRVSVLLFVVLFLFLVFEKSNCNILVLKKNYIVAIILLIGIFLHIFLYKLFLADLDPSRFHLWKFSTDLIRENPWTGIDYGEFRSYYQEYLSAEGIEALKSYGHPHNQHLFIALNFGLPLLIAFVAIMSLVLFKSLQQKNSLLFFFLLGSLVFMSFDLLLNSAKGVVPFAFFYSFIVYKNSKDNI